VNPVAGTWIADGNCSKVLSAIDREGYGERALSADQFDRLLRSPSHSVLVGGVKGESGLSIVTVAVLGQRNGELELLRIATKCDYRRQGAAKQTIADLSEKLKLRLSEVNLSGLKWARAVGFKAVGVSGGWIDLERG